MRVTGADVKQKEEIEKKGEKERTKKKGSAVIGLLASQ